MRSIKTFVLHLYFDVAVPERTCGDVRPLDETGAYPFKDIAELEKLLLQLANKRAQGPPIPLSPPLREGDKD